MKNLSNFILISLICIISCNNDSNKESNITNNNNPLLQEFNTPFGVPPFDKIKASDFPQAFEEGIKKENEEIKLIVDNPEAPTFANTIEAYLKCGELLSNITRIFININAGNSDTLIQKVAEEFAPRMTAHQNEMDFNAKLFERIKKVYEQKEKWNLNEEQMYLLENFYKYFIRNGVNLSVEKQEELKKINQELSALELQFNQNLFDETNNFKLVIEKKEDLSGIPEDIIANASEEAIYDSLPEKWVFTTRITSMIPFMKYADNRALREKLYMATINRGNNNNEYDNKEILSKIIILRSQKAKLLGYPDYASYKLEDCMAKTPQKVFELLEQLWKPAINVAEMEANELQAIIDKEGGKYKLKPWDWSYYAEKLRLQKYNLDEAVIRPYLKLENVINGFFLVANKLYGLKFELITNIPLPYSDATAYEVKDYDDSHLGILYLDLFPRESKGNGAWCDYYRAYRIKDGKPITPVVTLDCNFTKPTNETPTLLSMKETNTLFHEFGHALERLMSKTSYLNTFIAKDFSELPSQIMEHWAFNKEALKLYAKHYKTGELIPDDLVSKIENSHLFNQGYSTVENLSYALLDMVYHTQKDLKTLDIAIFEKEYFQKIGLIPQLDYRRSTYFGHITNGYDANFYSYIWSAVLENDAFEAFKENGIFDKKTANSFRKNILEKDGVEDPTSMFMRFRGREVKIDPLLKNRGLLY